MSQYKGYPFNLIRAIHGTVHSDPDVSDTVIQNTHLGELERVISGLKDIQKELIRLRYVENKTWSETKANLPKLDDHVVQLEHDTLNTIRNHGRSRYMAVPRYEYDLLKRQNDVLMKTVHLLKTKELNIDDVIIKNDTVVVTDIEYIKNTYRPIELGEFKIRTYNALKRNGLNTLGDITNLSEKELKSFRGIGVSTLQEIKDVLDTYHLYLIT